MRERPLFAPVPLWRRWTTAGVAFVVLITLGAGVTTALSPDVVKPELADVLGFDAAPGAGVVSDVPSQQQVLAPVVLPTLAPLPPQARTPRVAAPARPRKAKPSCAGLPSVPSAKSVVATLDHGLTANVYSSPQADKPEKSLDSPNADSERLVFLVKKRTDQWLYVQVPTRPNGYHGWVHMGDGYVLSTVRTRIVVQKCARRLTVFRDGVALWNAPVAVGQPDKPTPVGGFYVDSVIEMSNPRGSYGPWMVSVAGFSTRFQRFGNGIGQIAIHGTNKPSSIGNYASNGCVRMFNDAVTRLAKTVLPGTPVTVTP